MKLLLNKEWTIFLDRDGVINERPWNDYVKNPNEFVFLPGAVEAIRLLSAYFARTVVVTNQQGVGLGVMPQKELEKIHTIMLQTISEAGGKIDHIFCCTDLKTKPDNCRKPNRWMADEACRMFPEINLGKAVMVGDTASDIAFGKNLGMKTIQIGVEESPLAPDLQFQSLYQFAKYCLLK